MTRGDELPPMTDVRSRTAALAYLHDLFPTYTFRLRLPRNQCRASGVFTTFVPVVVGRRKRIR